MTRAPAAVASVIGQMPFLRTGDADTNLSRAMHLHGHISTAREAATRYRDAVLAHDDLRGALEKLMGYVHAQSWTGYVPAYTEHGPAREGYNPSPYRATLVAIVTEALKRGGDWRHYDSTRLALVPGKHLRAPWAEQRDGTAPEERGALWAESAP